MGFIIFCSIVSFIIESIVLHCCKGRQCVLLFLPFIVMELFPACIAAHAFITKKPSGVLGWRFSIAVSGWIFGAILLGCLVAWITWLFTAKTDDGT